MQPRTACHVLGRTRRRRGGALLLDKRFSCCVTSPDVGTAIPARGSHQKDHFDMPQSFESLRSLHAYGTVFALVVAGLVLGQDILIPIALATILAFVMGPLVRRLTQWGMPETLSATVVFTAALGLTVILGIILTAQILELTASLPNYTPNIVEKVRAISGLSRDDGIIKRAVDAVDLLEKAVRRELAPGGITLPDALPKSAQTDGGPVVVAPTNGVLETFKMLFQPFALMALTLLFTMFLMLQHADLRNRVVRIAGVDNLSGTTAAMSDAGQRLSRMFFAQALMNLAYGIAIAVLLYALGVPNAVLWGILAAIMRYVPFIGSFIAAVPPVLLAAGVDPGWTIAVATLLIFAVGEFAMGQMVEPLVLGRQTGMSPFAIIVCASFWTLIWGPIGLVLAVPLTSVLIVLGRHIPALEVFSVLLGDEEALNPVQAFYGRILAKDTLAAVDQLEDAIEETSLASATDGLLLPALNLAAIDHRRGRLDDARLAELRVVVSNVEAVIEHDAGETGIERRDDGPCEGATALVVPARGAVDAMATAYVARALRALTPWQIEGAQASSGLTALSGRGGVPTETEIAAVIIVTVGGVERRHLEILVRRAVSSFPTARIMTLEAGGNAQITANVGPSVGNDQRSAAVRHRRLADLAEALKVSAKADTGRRDRDRAAATAADVPAA